MPSIYLDHNATSPLLPAVARALADALSASYANPASPHQPGRLARRVLDDTREELASLLGADLTGDRADQLVLTSGGSEANHLALVGLAGETPGHVIVSAIEHPSILGPAEWLERRGWFVDRLDVSPAGVVDLDRLADLVTPRTRVVSLMLGNNETGVLQPVAAAAEICRAVGAPLHADATQVVGKLPVDFRGLGVAVMTLAAHKFHGPVGVGALAVRHGVTLAPQMHGGAQQGGLRPGTEAVALAVGMLAALREFAADPLGRANLLRDLRDRFETALCRARPEWIVNGAAAERLPHTSNIAFRGFNRQALLMAFDLAGIACSAGSACASGSTEASPVLRAMGCADDVLESSLRFSFGVPNTPGEVDEAARRILRICNDLERRKTQGKNVAESRGGK